jgi:hypothetical protein
VDIPHLIDPHSPFNPAGNRALLVIGEVNTGAPFHQHIDSGERAAVRRRCGAVRFRNCHVTGNEVLQFRGNIRRRQNEVDQPGGDRAAGHAVELGVILVLHDNQAPELLDSPGTAGAVTAGTGQDHPHRPFTGVFCKGAKKDVDRQVEPVLLLGKKQRSLIHGHVLFARYQIDRSGFNAYPVFRLNDPHRRMLRKQFSHKAFVIRRKVLDHHEREVIGGGHIAKKRLQRLQASGGRSHPDDAEIVGRCTQWALLRCRLITERTVSRTNGLLM